MQFYPHRVPLTSVGSAVSSSITATSSFIANFASIPVTTASLALNISGSTGTNGTNTNFPGPKGERGPRGVTGFRGDSVFLLSGSWHSGASCGTPAPCYAYSFAAVNQQQELQTFCDYGTLATYYSTVASLLTPTEGGQQMYSNDTCTAPLGALTLGGYAGNNKVATTLAGGILDFPGTVCSNQP